MKVLRYLQIEVLTNELQPASIQKVQEVSYMFIMPDVVKVQGQWTLRKRPISTTFLLQRGADGTTSPCLPMWCTCTCDLFQARSICS